MKHFRKVPGMLRLVLAAIIFTGCSRLGPGTNLSLSLPFRQDQSGFAADDMMVKSIVTLRLEGREPMVKTTVYPPGTVPRGQDLNIGLENVTAGTPFLIQFLAIYENTASGATKFYYGSQAGKLQANTTIEVTSDDMADTGKTIQINGRFLTGVNAGPTGRLLRQFKPPFNDPVITVDSSTIQDGWFEASVIDTSLASFRFTLAETGQTVFDNLTVQSRELSSYGPALMKIIKPTSFHFDPIKGSSQASPQIDFYVGFWGAAAAGPACYSTEDGVVGGEFRDVNLTLPLEYEAQSPTDLNLRRVAGGIGHSAASLPGSDCQLVFDPSTLRANH